MNIQDMHPVEKLAYGAAIVAILFNIPKIQQGMQQAAAIRSDMAVVSQEQSRILANEMAREGLTGLAEKRYAGQCEAVVTLADPDTYAGIQENEPIIAGAYAKIYEKGGEGQGKPINPSHVLQPGVLACDAYGRTAAIVPGPGGMPIAAEIAVTQNREIVQEFISRNGGIKPPTVARGEL